MTPTSTHFTNTIIHFFEVDSTNDEVKRLLSAGAVDLPLIVRADRQRAGRGRGTNRWWSDEGSLTFTIGLGPEAFGLRLEHHPRVALASALAIIEAIEALMPALRLEIRWPNDIEVGGRKLGGILPEQVDTAAGPCLALGIGLNIHTNLDAAPPAVRRLAATLAELGTAPSLDVVFDALLARIGPELAALAQDDPSQPARWAARDALRGQIVQLVRGTEIVTGTARGIDPRGGLLLESSAGALDLLFGGQVLRC